MNQRHPQQGYPQPQPQQPQQPHQHRQGYHQPAYSQPGQQGSLYPYAQLNSMQTQNWNGNNQFILDQQKPQKVLMTAKVQLPGDDIPSFFNLHRHQVTLGYFKSQIPMKNASNYTYSFLTYAFGEKSFYVENNDNAILPHLNGVIYCKLTEK